MSQDYMYQRYVLHNKYVNSMIICGPMWLSTFGQPGNDYSARELLCRRGSASRFPQHGQSRSAEYVSPAPLYPRTTSPLHAPIGVTVYVHVCEVKIFAQMSMMPF